MFVLNFFWFFSCLHVKVNSQGELTRCIDTGLPVDLPTPHVTEKHYIETKLTLVASTKLICSSEIINLWVNVVGLKISFQFSIPPL